MVSESALRAFPFGPVDGLDTRHGRAAQVRLVFVTDRWPEDALAEAVDRWRRLGCAEVCGILDFGRYERSLVPGVAAQSGNAVERWRATRQPGPAAGRAADARIRSAGGADQRCRIPCRLRRSVRLCGGARPDAVPGAAVAGVAPGSDGLEPHDQDGQRTLATLLAAAVPPDQAGALTGWLAAASEGELPRPRRVPRRSRAMRKRRPPGRAQRRATTVWARQPVRRRRGGAAPPCRGAAAQRLAADPGGRLAPGGGRPDCGARAHPQRRGSSPSAPP